MSTGNPPERTLILVERVKRLFLEMDRMAADQGATMVFVMIPELGQVDTGCIPVGLAQTRQLEIEKPQTIFSEFFERHGMKCIDLLPTMRSNGGASLYFAADRHWNRDGHRVAARAIAEFLTRHRFTAAPE